MTTNEINTIIRSDEYKQYMKALSRLASEYVSRIRVKFAEQAFEKYQDESIRRLVLAYGREAEDLDRRRLADFTSLADHTALDLDDHHTGEDLNDWPLNHAKSYADTIKFFFLK